MSKIFEVGIFDKTNTVISDTNENLLNRLNRSQLNDVMGQTTIFKNKLFKLYNNMKGKYES